MINYVVSTDEFYTKHLKTLLQLENKWIESFTLVFSGPDVPVVVVIERYVRGLKGELLVVEDIPTAIKRKYYLKRDFGKYKLVPMENTNEGQDDAVRKVKEDSGSSEDSGDVADSKA